MAESTSPRYVEPGWFTRTVFNPLIAWLTRAGFSVWGSRELRVGHHTEAFRAVEVADDDKVEILRAYLKRWKLEVGVFFDGVDAKAPEGTLREIAPGYPIFRIESAATRG